MIRPALILLLLLTALPALRAEDRLEDVCAKAMEQNREILASEKSLRAAQSRVGGALSFPDPMFGVDVQRSDTTRFRNWSDLEYMVQQDIPGWGKRKSANEVIRREAEAAGFQHLETVRQVRARVIQTYWDLWYAERAVEITRRNQHLAEQMTRSALGRYENGVGSQADILRAELESVRMSNEVVTMERDASALRTALNALMNESPETPRATERMPPLPALDQSMERFLSLARRYCCTLAGLDRQLEARKAAARAARVDRRPDFQFRVAARQFEDRGDISEYDTGVFMTIPWLWNGKHASNVRAADAELARMQAEFDDAVNQNDAEVRMLYTRADAAQRAMVQDIQEALPRAEQLVASQQEAYQTGRATQLELLDAQRALQDTHLGTYRATADFAKARASLDAVAAPWSRDEIAGGLISKEMLEEKVP